MRIDKRLTPEQRADRWLARHHRDLPPLSTSATNLLVQRLTARRRHNWIVIPPLVLFVLVSILLIARPMILGLEARDAIPPVGDLFILDSLTRSQEALVELSCAVFFLVFTALGAQELTYRADMRVARQLTSRLARSEDISIRTILGPRATRYATLLLIGDSLIAVALIAAGQGWEPWFHVTAFTAICASAALGIRRAVNRPTVAVDRGSLMIDERIRHSEVLAATSLLVWFWILESPATMTGLSLGLGFFLVLLQLALAIFSLFVIAVPPWRTAGSTTGATASTETTDASL